MINHLFDPSAYCNPDELVADILTRPGGDTEYIIAIMKLKPPALETATRMLWFRNYDNSNVSLDDTTIISVAGERITDVVYIGYQGVYVFRTASDKLIFWQYGAKKDTLPMSYSSLYNLVISSHIDERGQVFYISNGSNGSFIRMYIIEDATQSDGYSTLGRGPYFKPDVERPFPPFALNLTKPLMLDRDFDDSSSKIGRGQGIIIRGYLGCAGAAIKGEYNEVSTTIDDAVKTEPDGITWLITMEHSSNRDDRQRIIFKTVFVSFPFDQAMRIDNPYLERAQSFFMRRGKDIFLTIIVPSMGGEMPGSWVCYDTHIQMDTLPDFGYIQGGKQVKLSSEPYQPWTRSGERNYTLPVNNSESAITLMNATESPDRMLTFNLVTGRPIQILDGSGSSGYRIVVPLFLDYRTGKFYYGRGTSDGGLDSWININSFESAQLKSQYAIFDSSISSSIDAILKYATKKEIRDLIELFKNIVDEEHKGVYFLRARLFQLLRHTKNWEESEEYSVSEEYINFTQHLYSVTDYSGFSIDSFNRIGERISEDIGSTISLFDPLRDSQNKAIPNSVIDISKLALRASKILEITTPQINRLETKSTKHGISMFESNLAALNKEIRAAKQIHDESLLNLKILSCADFICRLEEQGSLTIKEYLEKLVTEKEAIFNVQYY